MSHLVLENICKQWGNKVVLDNVSFAAGQGSKPHENTTTSTGRRTKASEQAVKTLSVILFKW